ncbi:TPA: phage tail protein [Yersinia enterocolitica]|uniref:phage tail protein n=2 Tax=Yersinia enterocolitica TaxID=630 RepID=UPI002AC76466|nr:tail fiber protein [Yersinia enterocolitica]HDL7933094.1 tail fiber protein [Yersinia enterocolitica]HEN3469471.1 tail fiber protein [Yersinia enterocolitica]
MQKIGDIPNTRADSNGEFTDGNVAGGVPPTILPAAWFNTIQRELMSVLSAAEIDADSAQFNQVLLSIQKLIGEEIPDIKDASLTQKGIVQLSNATNSTSEILAATSKAVRAVDIAALKIANNLSEIKDAGTAAVAETLLNLGLGDAAKLGVATNAQMAIGTSTSLLPTVAAVMSLFSKRSFTANDYIRIPDVPGGLIIQSGSYTTPAGGIGVFSLPIPFPNTFMACVASINGSTGSYGFITTDKTSLSTFTLTGRNAQGILFTAPCSVISIGY